MRIFLKNRDPLENETLWEKLKLIEMIMPCEIVNEYIYRLTIFYLFIYLFVLLIRKLSYTLLYQFICYRTNCMCFTGTCSYSFWLLKWLFSHKNAVTSSVILVLLATSQQTF